MIAIYNLPSDDWMGLTHAYFPVAAFDEYAMVEGWVFGRKGEGYIALHAANGLRLVEQGLWAYRELRSPGLHNIWLCQMGRHAEDGDFESFKAKVIAHPPRFDNLSVQWRSVRGDELTFGWRGPLLVNGSEEPITGFRHYDNPYCQAELEAEEMIIQYQDQQMRLNFALEPEEA